VRLFITVEAPAWDGPASGRTEQYRRNALAKLIRDVAERVQVGGNEGTFERPDMVGEFRLEIAANEAANAA
jgi:hypothetical protein